MCSKLGTLIVILIDEVSIAGSGMSNFIKLCLHEIMGANQFGAVGITAIEDLFQLQPVFDRWVFQKAAHAYAPLAANVWQDDFTIYELIEIMRQKEDKQFSQILNRIREGQHTPQDLSILKTHVTPFDNSNGG